MAILAKRIDPQTLNLKEQVVSINRVTKVVKGGKNMSFSALVVIGDPGAKVVGFGVGKAKEVPSAIRKGIEAAKKNLRRVHVLDTTIAHQVLGRFGSGLVLLKPAPEGTGVIAGGPVRAVLTAAGIPNVLTKSIGTHNPHNVVKATIKALELLRDRGSIAEMRGLTVEKLTRPGPPTPRGMDMEGMIKIKLVRSPICTPEKHKRIVRGLGLRKLNQVVVRPDTPGFRGMVRKVPHLLAVIE
jgi:small subunit ribosomal protein S5